MARGEAERRFTIAEDFGETFIETVGYDVPVSDDWPDGVNYRFQYGVRDETIETAWDDGTIFRYDNKDHPGAPHHHKHTTDGEIIAVDFDGLDAHRDRFLNEVIQHEQQRERD